MDNSNKTSRNFKLPELSSAKLNKLLPYITAALCVLLCLFCLISIGSLRKSVETLGTSVNQRMDSLERSNSQLMDRITAVEAIVNSTQSTVSGEVASRYIQISKQPSSVSTYVGRTDALIFSVKAEGNNMTMTWQKYDEVSGEWINVNFDIDGLCPEYGIRLYDDAAHGTTEVWAKNVTLKAYGTYRCLITDTSGSKVYSDSVILSERDAD